MNIQPAFALDDYDFVDFGCSSGGSIQFAQHKLGGARGLGLDISQAKVDAARQVGYDARVTDVTGLSAEQLGTVRFVTMLHFLEHLGSVDLAGDCIRSACRIADEFVFIRQPFFDADSYLAALGLKLYWSHWHGHPNRMKAAELQAILEDLLGRRKIRRFILFNRTPIVDSDDPCVHPQSSPVDQHEWDPQKHGPKPFYKFQLPVYREVGALIHTRARKLDEKPRRLLLSCDVISDRS
jgi:hypothetical protein